MDEYSDDCDEAQRHLRINMNNNGAVWEEGQRYILRGQMKIFHERTQGQRYPVEYVDPEMPQKFLQIEIRDIMATWDIDIWKDKR